MSEDQAQHTWFADMDLAGWQVYPRFHQQRLAAVHTVRSALPTVHARALKPDPYWGPGWPTRVWKNRHDSHWVAFEWGDEGTQPLLGLARVDDAGIVPMDAWRWERHQASRTPTAPVLPQPPAGWSFIDFESHFEAKWLPAATSPTLPAARTIESILESTVEIRAKLMERAHRAEAEVIQYLDEHWPASPGDSNWSEAGPPLNWRMPVDEERAAIYTILRTDASANFSLPDPPDTIKLAVRDAPFYKDALIVRLVDLRGERTRFTHFLVDTRSRTQLALGCDSQEIHEFNETLEGQGRLCIDRMTCPEYVRFFCEFVQGEEGAFMVLGSADDMDWLDESRKAKHPTGAIKPLRLRFPQPPRGDGETSNTNSDRVRPVVAVCLAYINYDRFVYVTALVVHSNGLIDMKFERPIQDGDWPVAPTLFDDEFQFRLSKARDTGENPDVDRHDARGSRRTVRAGATTLISALPTGPGELDPCRLRRHIEIHDAVDLRGHELGHALFVHGVVFWGRVDLRSATVKGDVDLTRCVFREGLLLDDAEIQGSLVLHRVAASRISLRGVQVQGRLDMSEAKVDGAVHADGAGVQGNLDARGLSASALSATGLKLRGDLELGCRHGLKRGYPNNARLNAINARNASVDGSVAIRQPGGVPDRKLNRADRELRPSSDLPSVDFTNARINGSFHLLPNDNPDDGKAYELALGCRILALGGARIDGDLILKATQVEWLSASYTKVGGNVEVQGLWVQGRAQLNDMRVCGWVVIEPYQSPFPEGSENRPLASRFDSGLDLSFSHVARLALSGIDCRGDLNLSRIRSESIVRLEIVGDLPCRMRARSPLGKTSDGNLHAYGLSALQFELEGVDVEGDINLKGVDLLEIYCRPGLLIRPGDLDDTSPESALLLPRCAFFRMVNARVRGNVELVCIQVSGAQSMGEWGLLMRDSEVGGELLLAQSNRVDRLFLTPRQSEVGLECPVLSRSKLVSAIAGPVIFKRCTFGAQLDLTGVQVDKGISLEDSRLKGDLVIKAVPGVPRAHAASLDLRKLHCANDVDLTGLTLGDAGTMATDPLLKASHAEVTADLHLFHRNGASWTHARIHGHIDLSFAKLTHLVVHRAVVVGQDAQLDLRHAQIARIEIPRDEHDTISLPKTRLRGATIELWDPQCDADDLHKLYCELLGSDVDCSPQAAAALERRLRLDGLTDVADSVYRYGYDRQFVAEVSPRMQPLQRFRRRVMSFATAIGLVKALTVIGIFWPKTKRWGRMARHGLFKLSLGFGTQIYRLLMALLLIAVLALPITRSSSNFEPSPSALAVPRDRLASTPVDTRGQAAPSVTKRSVPPVKGSAPLREEWGYAEAVQLMLKYWLPMLPLHARDEWQPRSEGQTAWSWRGDAPCQNGGSSTILDGCLPMAPEDSLNIMQLLCWMGWPLLLTMFVRRVLRQ